MRISLLLMLLWVMSTKAFAQTTPIAYYPFNGNANDSSGNNIHGSINKAIPTMDRFGRANFAYKFSGDTNTYIEVTHNSLLNLNGDKSISIWIKVDTIPNQKFPGIVYKEGTTNFYPTFGLQFNHDNGYAIKDRYKVGFFFGNGSTNKLLSTKQSYLDTMGRWMHVVATYSQTSGYQKIYFNGIISDSIYIGTYSSSTSTKPMQIGRSTSYMNFSENHFKGSLDDLRIYGSELSPDEVSDLFNENPFSCALAAHYKFNGNSSDSSGNNLHASVNTAIPTFDRFGNPNSAYKFVGDSTTFIQVPHDNLLNMNGNKSISLWYKLDTLPNQKFPGLVYKEGQSFSFPTYGIQLNEEAGYSIRNRFKTGFFFGNGYTGTNKLLSTQESYSSHLGDWVHIAATYSIVTGYQKIYFNGTLSDSLYIGKFYSDISTKPLEIGRSTSFGNYSENHFKGAMDDIRLYCYELNAHDIQDLYTDSSEANTTTSINVPSQKLSSMVVYPNPANTVVYFGNIAEKTAATIYDITGRVCSIGVLSTSEHSLNISSLSTGIYTVVLTNSEGVFSQKLVIQK